MKNRNRPLHAIALLSILLALIPVASRLHAAPGGSSQGGSVSNLEYKMISGFKQPFNDDLQIHLSKGWTPVGGVGVTVWNNDLYFAQLLSRPAGQ